MSDVKNHGKSIGGQNSVIKQATERYNGDLAAMMAYVRSAKQPGVWCARSLCYVRKPAFRA